MPRPTGKSPVWQFFTADSNGKAVCNTCGVVVSRTKGNTKSMASHLVSHNQPLASQKDVEDIEKRVARFLASTNTAANVVENSSFRALFSKADQAHLPSRKQLYTRIVPSLAKEIQDELKKNLSGKEISIMTDTWTNKGGKVSLNAVVGSYLDEDWNLKSVVLAATPLSGRHTADTLQKEIQRVIKFYDLNVVSVTSDSASNVIKAVANMKLPSIPCFLHQLHLIVSSCLDEWSDNSIIDTLKKLARNLNLSSSKRDFYFEACENAGLSKVGVPQCVPTRWNSTFEMLDRARVQMPAVKATLAEYKLGRITSKDERELIGICNLLRPFLQYTLRISSDSAVSTEIFLVADELQEHLSQIINDESPGVAEVAESMQSDLNRRMEKYNNHETLSFLRFLDPRIRANYADLDWADIEKQFTEKHSSDPISLVQPSSSTSAYPLLQARFNKTVAQSSPLSSEMGRYIHECTSDPISLEIYPPHFWKGRMNAYPRLASHALTLFTVSPSSVAAERLFSSAGCIYKSHLRNRLSGLLAESLLLIRLVGANGRYLSVQPAKNLVDELTGATNESTGVATDDESDEEEEEPQSMEY